MCNNVSVGGRGCEWETQTINYFARNILKEHPVTLMADFKIVCSLLNKFHPTIDDRPDAVEILNVAQARLNMVNHLSSFIQREHLNRRRTIFQSINSSAPHLDSFPRLTFM